MLSAEWNEFLAAVEDAKKSVYAGEKGVWFRGHRLGEWRLTPSLFRTEKGLLREETLFTEVSSRGAEFISKAKSDWEIAALMQHHGIPTRLLDWTENFFVALYFSISGQVDEPCIWVANPFLIGAKSTGEKCVYDFYDDPHMSYKKLFASQNSWPFDLPVPICSPWSHRRLENQQGFFTVHGNRTEDLDVLTPRFVKKVSIAPGALFDAKSMLKNVGIDRYSIFHDLDSLAYVLKEKHDLM